MISIKPKWCAKIMNREKTIEVRKENVGKAVQTLINENGYADIYVYCTKDKWLLYKNKTENKWDVLKLIRGYKVSSSFNGKVIFKFRCYKVDDYVNGRKWSWKVGAPMWGACNDYEYIFKDACLTDDELRNYVEDLAFSAIHISVLEIFDRPRELWEFYKIGFDKALKESLESKPYPVSSAYIEKQYQLIKAPQSFCYIEVEDEQNE